MSMKIFTPLFFLVCILFTCIYSFAQSTTEQQCFAGSAEFSFSGSDLNKGLPANGSFQLVKSVSELGGGGYLNITSPSNHYFFAAHTSNNTNDRVWYKTINVIPGRKYNFCATATLLKNLGNGADYTLGLYVNGVSVATGRVTFNITQICGTYTVPAGVTSIELSIKDPKKGLFFVAITDVCSTLQLATNLSLGNQVWNDFDGDGKRDDNEPGIPEATVSLYTDNNGDNLPDGSPIKTTVTDAIGHYQFNNLTEGRYIVSLPVLPGSQKTPNTTTQNTSPFPDNNIDNDNNLVNLAGPNGAGGTLYTNAITLTANQEPTNDGDDVNGNNTLDLAECGNSYLGDFVWNDLNGNGVQDANEPGLNNVLVTITFSDGRTASTLTHTYSDANNPNSPNFDGYYNFPNLGPGTYKISFTTPASLYSSPANRGADRAKDSDPVNGAPASVTIIADQSNFTIDAGFTAILPPPPLTCSNLSIGNMVFIDANGNGVKEITEQGISGLTVQLYTDNDGNNIPDGAAISTVITADDGTYYFGNLAAGKYIVGVTTGSSYQLNTFANATPNDNKDNDNNGIRTVNGEVRTNYFTLSAGDEPVNDGSDNNSNLTIDFGLKPVTAPVTDHTGCHNNCTHTTCGHANCGKKTDDGIKVTTMSVSPNPANAYFNLFVNAVKSGIAQIRITDASGHIVISKEVTIAAGPNSIIVNNLSNLKTGSYNVQMLFNYHVYNEQILLIK